MWSLVRHTAGLLKKRVEDLAEVILLFILLCLLSLHLVILDGGKTMTTPRDPGETSRCVLEDKMPFSTCLMPLLSNFLLISPMASFFLP